MKAAIGDRIVIRGRTIGQISRIGIVTEVRGRDGEPPFMVRWLDTGHECFFFPGPDAVIEHPQPAGAPPQT